MTLSGDCAIWLYGSHARGDADSMSDVDILVISDGDITPGGMASVVGCPSRLSIARYAWGEIIGMADYGSLFLRHLQLEGRPLWEGATARGRLGRLLSKLPRYSLAGRDLKGFYTVLDDVRNSLGSEAHLVFELATVGAVFRHACILGCALSGTPSFSRFEPVTRLVRRWALVSSWADEFPALYVYRMYADGRSARFMKPSRDTAHLWCNRTEMLLAELGVRIDEYS